MNKNYVSNCTKILQTIIINTWVEKLDRVRVRDHWLVFIWQLLAKSRCCQARIKIKIINQHLTSKYFRDALPFKSFDKPVGSRIRICSRKMNAIAEITTATAYSEVTNSKVGVMSTIIIENLTAKRTATSITIKEIRAIAKIKHQFSALKITKSSELLHEQLEWTIIYKKRKSFKSSPIIIPLWWAHQISAIKISSQN